MNDLFSALDDGFETDVSSSNKYDSDNEKTFNEDELNIENDEEQSNKSFLMQDENENINSNDLSQNTKNENFNETKKIKLKNKQKQKNSQILAKFDAKILALAKKAKMKTLLKKQIFCTIMSSTVLFVFTF